MTKIELDLAEDVHRWLTERAAEHGFTLTQMVEHILVLESGLRKVDALGRSIKFRDTVFRDTVYRQLTTPIDVCALKSEEN